MWHLLALAVLSRSTANVTVDGVSYGPRQTLTCTWFTNFENSRFEACRRLGKIILRKDENASIDCVGDICSKDGR